MILKNVLKPDSKSGPSCFMCVRSLLRFFRFVSFGFLLEAAESVQRDSNSELQASLLKLWKETQVLLEPNEKEFN